MVASTPLLSGILPASLAPLSCCRFSVSVAPPSPPPSPLVVNDLGTAAAEVVTFPGLSCGAAPVLEDSRVRSSSANRSFEASSSYLSKTGGPVTCLASRASLSLSAARTLSFFTPFSPSSSFGPPTKLSNTCPRYSTAATLFTGVWTEDVISGGFLVTSSPGSAG